jgi:hypothetical protein
VPPAELAVDVERQRLGAPDLEAADLSHRDPGAAHVGAAVDARTSRCATSMASGDSGRQDPPDAQAAARAPPAPDRGLPSSPGG